MLHRTLGKVPSPACQAQNRAAAAPEPPSADPVECFERSISEENLKAGVRHRVDIEERLKLSPITAHAAIALDAVRAMPSK